MTGDLYTRIMQHKPREIEGFSKRIDAITWFTTSDKRSDGDDQSGEADRIMATEEASRKFLEAGLGEIEILGVPLLPSLRVAELRRHSE